ncbi:hypothetical protein HK099_007523 [Clydaea vesicula]|uniref:Uncharacterized protein n=1 Tax=Clydaea vesicula TaxID=447962 RepID=A0AAD5TWU4_9FUNG|nr:hypothetical protein HK099_007523 [Clydaea vesicula]
MSVGTSTFKKIINAFSCFKLCTKAQDEDKGNFESELIDIYNNLPSTLPRGDSRIKKLEKKIETTQILQEYQELQENNDFIVAPLPIYHSSSYNSVFSNNNFNTLNSESMSNNNEIKISSSLKRTRNLSIKNFMEKINIIKNEGSLQEEENPFKSKTPSSFDKDHFSFDEISSSTGNSLLTLNKNSTFSRNSTINYYQTSYPRSIYSNNQPVESIQNYEEEESEYSNFTASNAAANSIDIQILKGSIFEDAESKQLQNDEKKLKKKKKVEKLKIDEECSNFFFENFFEHNDIEERVTLPRVSKI